MWKGKIPYSESLTLQDSLKKRACKNRQAFIIGFECPACITLGMRGEPGKDLNPRALAGGGPLKPVPSACPSGETNLGDLADSEPLSSVPSVSQSQNPEPSSRNSISRMIAEYRKRGVEIRAVKRGGQATLHAPGQLVMYPVMDLLQWKIRPRDFLSLLEQITCDVLKEYGIRAKKQESSAGLFTKKGKIAFFGIHISKGVSQHGLSLNVSNDLKLFNVIRSCGVSHRPHASFQSYGLKPNLQEVFSLWCKKAKHFFLPS